jgi:hypothetical protein
MDEPTHPKLARVARIVVVVAGIAAVVVVARVLQWIEQIAMLVLDSAVLIAQWGVVLVVSLVVLLVIIDVVALLVRRQRRRLKARHGIQVCSRPTNEAILHSAPISPLDAAMAAPVAQELQATGVPTGNFIQVSEQTMIHFREELPDLLLRPAHAMHFDSEVTRPVYERLQNGWPELKEYINLTCVPYRKQFWLTRRALNRISFGRLGLHENNVYTRDCPEHIIGNFGHFRDWFWENGWPMLPVVERELWPASEAAPPSPIATVIQGPFRARPTAAARSEAHPVKSPLPALPRHIDLDARQRQRQAQQLRERQAAQDVIEAVEVSLLDPVAWLDPEQKLLSLHEAVSVLLNDDPQLAAAKALLADLEVMRAEVARATAWVHKRLDEPYDRWPPILNEACACAAAEATTGVEDRIVVGHALRLYLTQFLYQKSKDPRTAHADDLAETHEPDEEIQPVPAALEMNKESTDETDNNPIPEPTASPRERVEAMF